MTFHTYESQGRLLSYGPESIPLNRPSVIPDFPAQTAQGKPIREDLRIYARKNQRKMFGQRMSIGGPKHRLLTILIRRGVNSLMARGTVAQFTMLKPEFRSLVLPPVLDQSDYMNDMTFGRVVVNSVMYQPSKQKMIAKNRSMAWFFVSLYDLLYGLEYQIANWYYYFAQYVEGKDTLDLTEDLLLKFLEELDTMTTREIIQFFGPEVEEGEENDLAEIIGDADF